MTEVIHDEQEWQTRWWDWSQHQLDHLAEEIRKLHATRTHDVANSQRLDTMKKHIDQLQTMLDRQDPCFARIRARIRTSEGEESVSFHVHNYAYLQNISAIGEKEDLNISHLTGLADLVRDPHLTMIRIDPDGPYRHELAPIAILEATVEDIALGADHTVTSVAPRHGLIWEDRVRSKLGAPAQSVLDVLADVLSPEQSQLVNTVPQGRRGLVLTGCAGSGKTVVAAHHVAVQFRRLPGWYLVPTPALGASIAPVLPRLDLPDTRARVLTMATLLHELWPELVGPNGIPEGVVRDSRDTTWQSIKVTADSTKWRATARTVFEERLQRKYDELALLNSSILEMVRGTVKTLSPQSQVVLSQLERWDRSQGEDVLQTVYAQIDALPDIQQIPLLRHMDFTSMVQKVNNDHALDWRVLYETTWRQWGASITNQEYLSGPPTGDDVPALLWLAAEFSRSPATAPQWVIIDEVQNMPLPWIQALQSLVPDTYWIFSGDTMQGWQSEDPDLSQLARQLDMTDEQLPTVSLTQSFRIPEHLFKAAERLRACVNGDIRQAQWLRYHLDAGTLHVIRRPDEKTLLAQLKEQVTEWGKQGIHNIAIIVPPDKLETVRRYLVQVEVFTGHKAYSGGTILTTLPAVSGLEFDAVGVYGGDISDYPSTSMGARKLYTAITRSRRMVTCFLLTDLDRDQRDAIAKARIEQQYQNALADAQREFIGTNRYGQPRVRSARQQRELRTQAEDERASRLEALKVGLPPEHHPSSWFAVLEEVMTSNS